VMALFLIFPPSERNVAFGKSRWIELWKPIVTYPSVTSKGKGKREQGERI
jgi:hypothetical protein